MTDGRARFLEWCEQVKDRVALFQSDMVRALDVAEKKEAEIDATESLKMGVGAHASQLLQ